MPTNPGSPPGVDHRDRREVYAPEASRQALACRAGLLRRLREFFDQQGLMEVETPALARDIVVERHLRPWTATPLPAHAGAPAVEAWWLQPSPELHMKRILAAHGMAIYQVCHAFRAGEAGRLHNPEFTLVEWYRPNDDMDDGMAFLDLLSQEMLNRGPCNRLSYGEAFKQYAGVDPHGSSIAELREAAASLGIDIPAALARDDSDAWLNVLLSAAVEPNLGRPHPTLLYHYPASQAALARIVEIPHPRGRVSVAERFELYVDGIELANGYHDLLDPAELRRRAASLNQGRLDDGDPPLPEENRLLAAMESGMPRCCGVALGFDRLVMIAAGATSIREVMAFPADIA